MLHKLVLACNEFNKPPLPFQPPPPNTFKGLILIQGKIIMSYVLYILDMHVIGILKSRPMFLYDLVLGAGTKN